MVEFSITLIYQAPSNTTNWCYDDPSATAAAATTTNTILYVTNIAPVWVRGIRGEHHKRYP